MFRHRVAQELVDADTLSLLLDYDGTLVPLAPTPEEAAPTEELLALLRRVATRRGTRITIVSGRDRDSLEHWLGDLPIAIFAEHGFWYRGPLGQAWERRIDVSQDAMSAALAHLEQLTAGKGGRIERKRVGAAWHYRGLEIDDVEVVSLRRSIDARVATVGYEVIPGARVLEVRARGVHKGLAADHARREAPSAKLAAIGDDHTDEDMFRALPRDAITVHVGERETVARFRVSCHRAVREVLSRLAEPDPR